MQMKATMHPNLFLRTLWQRELRAEVFVAMSFDPRYASRFDDVFRPAIRSVSIDHAQLDARRVDLSKSGDSILVEINDGIAHAQLVLADISVVGRDAATGRPYRNANVMYEVGLALACRQPSEVVLVRDDNDHLLFDISVIPCPQVDFSDIQAARQIITDALVDRIATRNLLRDARTRTALAALSADEILLMQQVKDYSLTDVWGFKDDGGVNFLAMAAIPRLLDKQLIQLAGRFTEGHPGYRWTPLGQAVLRLVQFEVRTFEANRPPPGQESPQDASASSDSAPPAAV